MKTNKAFIITSLIALFCAAVFFSCENPISLGPQLDISGPVVGFTSPAPRETVPALFDIAGTVSDGSPIETLLLKASLNNEEIAKQWRYTKSKQWEVSENYGANWAAYSAAKWDGSEKSATWNITIDMSIGGGESKDGEYTFSVQAWDTGGFSDDNSLKTIVLIYDTDPPKVEVFNPYLYSRYASYDPVLDKFGVSANDTNGQELQSLRATTDWRVPSLLGKFLTQEFQLQWQIEDNHDIASIEILFYNHTVDVDDIEETSIPEGYIYSYTGSNSPNGSVWVPNLKGNAGTYSEDKYDGGIIYTPIGSKTTIKVVALCYDMAHRVNQEKVLGYFIFWPEAAEPWIIYTDGMEAPEYYAGQTYTPVIDGEGKSDEGLAAFKEDVFMIYPGRSIKATAFQAQGASRVEYSLYEYKFPEKTIGNLIALSYLKIDNNFSDELNAQETGVTVRNSLRPNGTYSTIFPWSFTPPPRSGYYAIRATPYDFNGVAGRVYESVFMVQDITFPDFPEPPEPAASIPLFKAIQGNKITISGIVSDATEVVSLYIVWINPQSTSYAAMSQLSYFRDSGYAGWKQAVQANLQEGTSFSEGIYDSAHPNKVWKVHIDRTGEDYQTFRQLYSYSLELDITTDLNIAGQSTSDNQPLISQVFLLRAENPDGKCTIITYAPQGDTAYPTIKIDRVLVSRGQTDVECLPGEYQQVSKFQDNDRIRVYGSWTEDSTEILPIQTYLTPNVEFEINRTKVNGTLTPATGNADRGTFFIDVRVGPNRDLDLADMMDTLAVSATIHDIGGNPAEVANSWLIESDTLRFLRISSEIDDGAYRDLKVIDIFIEFNKPVMLKSDRSQTPVLILNTGGIATYKLGQNTESSRQYFTYIVAANENTPVNANGEPTQFLNVTGISIDGGNTEITTDSASAWQAAGYPFTWQNKTMSGWDEIRITSITAHREPDPGTGGVQNTVTGGDLVWTRVVPVTSNQNDPDYMFTLGGGKRIQIDNAAPRITSFSASPQGWHRVGADIYITATFNKPVKLGDTLPQLTLNTTRQTTDQSTDVRVNNNQITFRYTVNSGDNVSPLAVTGFSGDILDIPGTRMSSLPPTTGTGAVSRTLTGVNLDNTAPLNAPSVTVHSGSPTTQNQISPTTTLYNNAVWIQITATGATGDNLNLGRVEYTLNGSWNSLTTSTTAVTNVQLVNEGPYTILTRQIDQAGNQSPSLTAITFTRDSGTLITRISSTKPNGLYTHNTTGNGKEIPITIYFRKAVNVTAVTGITLNAVRGVGNGTAITVNTVEGGLPRNNVTELTFNYTVTNENSSGSNDGDRTPGTSFLNVTGIGTITATDTSTPTGVDVTQFFVMPAVNSQLNLGGNKEITVQTGALTNTAPSFVGGSIQADGSYNTTLQIPFNHTIFKGSGTITIEQIAGANTTAYRLPTVLTESQYSRFKNVAALSSDIDTYYTKGTNGYINGQGSDTSTKYVLNYQYNPNSSVTGDNIAFQGDRHIDSAFFVAFRTAEKITIPVSSQAVNIINGTTTNSTLTIQLNGSNAPQVPGATYTVTVTPDSVKDNLGNSSGNITESVNLGGVAKPFVRIKRTQDIIGARQTAGTTSPTLTATQPSYANVRMDSRTPNSSIAYWATTKTYEATSSNWTSSGPTAAPEGAATRPTVSGNGTAITGQIQIGDANHRGLKWWVVARASAGGVNSAESDEMAYRTAITYRLAALALADTTGQQFMREGGQIWIRGGDSVGSSSIPGFPFTWEDNFTSLRDNHKRAGIRLMTLVANTWPNGGNMGTTAAGTSTWQFLTWEINATAYVDFILGHDAGTGANGIAINDYNTYESASLAEVWQYGPRYWALQRGGWAASKSLYPVYPGEIRYLATNVNNNTNMNFSAAFNSRPSNGRQNATTPTGNTLPVTIDPANQN